MDKFHRDQIRKNRLALIQDMEPGPVADYLVQEGVLTDAMLEDIEAARTRRDKVSKILDDIPRRGPGAFEHFYNGLIETEQPHLADLIWPDRLSQTRAKSAGRRSLIAQVSEDRDDEDDDDKLPEKFPTADIADFSVIDKLIDVKDPELKALLTNPKESTYKNFSQPKGRAVIINNVLFGGDKDRKGSEKDATQLQRLFEKLNYKVVLHSNLTAEKMLGMLKEESKNSDHARHHSFILIILSHGANDVVYGTDWKKLSIPVITDIFNGKNCPFLVDKPKLFFIQACQGENYDKGSGDTQADGGDLAEYFSRLELAGRQEERTDSSDVSVPTMADILVAMATTPDYVSWRNESLGTWFIIALVYAISKYAHKYDISQILTKVNYLVSKGETIKGKYRQVSQWRSSLRKKFYFFPGLHQS
ncbi:caspase-2 [Lingula anatina]|uniref:Caspase-2 n=1 Tax=Lingula anatina TaxID=7574 RepID=A0A1S3JXN3_LINAN|nr:caspase-2 [Lingula anatina]|eukprot:XP_013414814.1 caspase-2 [Lingula anatina]